MVSDIFYVLKYGKIENLLSRYKALYVPLENLSSPPPDINENALDYIEKLQRERRIIALSMYNKKRLQKEYKDFLKKLVSKGEEEPNPEEENLEEKLIPILEWGHQLNAEMVFPNKPPYSDIGTQLEKENLVLKP